MKNISKSMMFVAIMFCVMAIVWIVFGEYELKELNMSFSENHSGSMQCFYPDSVYGWLCLIAYALILYLSIIVLFSRKEHTTAALMGTLGAVSGLLFSFYDIKRTSLIMEIQERTDSGDFVMTTMADKVTSEYLHTQQIYSTLSLIFIIISISLCLTELKSHKILQRLSVCVLLTLVVAQLLRHIPLIPGFFAFKDYEEYKSAMEDAYDDRTTYHYIADVLCFIAGAVYLFILACISKKTESFVSKPEGESMPMTEPQPAPDDSQPVGVLPLEMPTFTTSANVKYNNEKAE